MHYFVVEAVRKETGSVISLLHCVPTIDENGKTIEERDLAKLLYGFVRTLREMDVFPFWQIGVRAAKQEDIDQFEQFLEICGV